MKITNEPDENPEEESPEEEVVEWASEPVPVGSEAHRRQVARADSAALEARQSIERVRQRLSGVDFARTEHTERLLMTTQNLLVYIQTHIRLDPVPPEILVPSEALRELGQNVAFLERLIAELPDGLTIGDAARYRLRMIAENVEHMKTRDEA